MRNLEKEEKEVLKTDEVSENEIKNDIIKVSFIYFIASTLFIICDIFFRIVAFKKLNIPSHSYLFAVFFGMIIFSFVWALTKKTFKTTIICYISILILNIINQIKIFYTDEPLYFSDINFLGKIGDLISLVSTHISFKEVLIFILFCITYGLILSLITFFAFKYNTEIKNKKLRIGIVIIDIIIILLLFFPNASMKDFYLKFFFKTDNHKDFNSYVTNKEFYERNGFINGMYGVVLNNRFTEPENYDENNLNELLENVPNINVNKIGKPNIIVVFSESFFDLDLLTEMQFNKKITSNFNKLKNEGEFINLVSPTYGGMSENVAFEFLTGGSMNFFPKGYIPIMSLYSKESAYQIPSLVKVLNNNGYYSQIVYGKDYYNSQEECFKIGFNSYDEIIENKDYDWVSDEYLTDLLIKKIESKKSKEPLFYMLETIESHMPFQYEKYDNYDVVIENSKLTKDMNRALQAYAQGIYNADKQLGRLYEFIKSYEEPTMLVFLGDHLPFIHTGGGKNVIDELEYFNTKDELVNNFRKYNTQCLVLSNFDANIDFPDYMGVDLLFNHLVNHLDIENETYYKWLYHTSDILSGLNRYVSIDKNGKLYNTNNLPEDMKEIYDTKILMQYKFFINIK